MIAGLNVCECPSLHLASSVRSFRTPQLADFVSALLEIEVGQARQLYASFREKYPIVITRDLAKAKAWVRERCHGATRYGLLASSGAMRLKPEGIFVRNSCDVKHWFLDGKNDVRSSYALEEVATEFDIQGLELDYTIVAWDADFRYSEGAWEYYNFVGTRWNRVSQAERRLYLISEECLSRSPHACSPRDCPLYPTWRRCRFQPPMCFL